MTLQKDKPHPLAALLMLAVLVAGVYLFWRWVTPLGGVGK